MVPSTDEAFGRVIVEAQVNGIPVVARRTGGIPEALGDAGVLLPPDAPGAAWPTRSRASCPTRRGRRPRRAPAPPPRVRARTGDDRRSISRALRSGVGEKDDLAQRAAARLGDAPVRLGGVAERQLEADERTQRPRLQPA
jgi:hypothetical protein